MATTVDQIIESLPKLTDEEMTRLAEAFSKEAKKRGLIQRPRRYAVTPRFKPY